MVVATKPRRCNRCKTRPRARRDATYCRECENEKARDWYAQHKEKTCERVKERRRRDPERYKAYCREDYARNAEKRKAAALRYYYANRERVLARVANSKRRMRGRRWEKLTLHQGWDQFDDAPAHRLLSVAGGIVTTTEFAWLDRLEEMVRKPARRAGSKKGRRAA